MLNVNFVYELLNKNILLLFSIAKLIFSLNIYYIMVGNCSKVANVMYFFFDSSVPVLCVNLTLRKIGNFLTIIAKKNKVIAVCEFFRLSLS